MKHIWRELQRWGRRTAKITGRRRTNSSAAARRATVRTPPTPPPHTLCVVTHTHTRTHFRACHCALCSVRAVSVTDGSEQALWGGGGACVRLRRLGPFSARHPQRKWAPHEDSIAGITSSSLYKGAATAAGPKGSMDLLKFNIMRICLHYLYVNVS